MKNLIYILNMLMILIFASCKDENAFMPGDDGLTCYSILVSAPNNATRAVYEESADGSSVSVKWEKGDVIILSLKINSEKKEYSFVYKKDTLDGAGKFVHYGEIPNATRIYGTVSFGSDPGAYKQVQKNNNKCKEWLIKDISAFDLTKHEVISLLPSNVRSLIHIQLLSPALFPGKSVLEIKGLKNPYTITLGENPDYVFADKGEILDIYVTIPADQKSIEKGTTLKFYFYAYDNLAGSDMTVEKRQKNGDEYHYYMKCNETIALNNDKVVKMPLPNRPTHTAIQLGLSVKWATMNIGATSDQPGEASFGGYYPWGMVDPDYQMAWDNATSGNYLYGKTKDEIANFFSPYVENNGFQGFYKEYDGKKYGDAATYNWGSDWMTPSWNQMNELMQQMIACREKGKTFSNWEEWKSSTKTKTQRPKNNGWWVYGKGNYSEKKLWLPAAGGVHNNKKGGETNESPASNDGYNGIYMTSIRNSDDNRSSLNLYFDGNSKTDHLGTYNVYGDIAIPSNLDKDYGEGYGTNYFVFYRHHGVSVRPVRKPN